ncbi:MAG: hypothetical protein V4501_08595 [Pseudomonadota bacterium]
MTLEDIIEIFGILSGRYSNEPKAKAEEYGLICHGYISFLKITFLKIELEDWPAKKLALKARLENLKEDTTLSSYRALIDKIQEDVSVEGMTLKSLIPTVEDAQQFIQELINMMSIDKNILNDPTVSAETNKADIFAQLSPIKTAFEKQEWASVIKLYSSLQIKLQPYSHDYFDDAEYMALVETLEIYLKTLAKTAATRQDFNEATVDFYFLFMEARAYPRTNLPLIEDFLTTMLNRLIVLFNGNISITNNTLGYFKTLIKLAVQQVRSGASPTLNEQVLELQRKLANTLYEATSKNIESIINNLLLAHRLVINLFEVTKSEEDQIFLYIIHQKLYLSLKKFAYQGPDSDLFKNYFKKVIGNCNELQGSGQHWAEHLRFYLKQIFACVKIINPNLTLKMGEFYLETQLVEYQRISSQFLTSVDKDNLIRCQEALAVNHFLVAEEYREAKNFKHALQYLYKARLGFQPILSSSAKAKQFELATLKNIVMVLATIGFNLTWSQGILSTESMLHLETAIKENNTIPASYMDNPLEKLAMGQHQSQFAQLLFNYATILFNNPAAAYLSISFYRTASLEINKITGLDTSQAIQQQQMYYNNAYLNIAFDFCRQFNNIDLESKAKLELLIETHLALSIKKVLTSANTTTNDLAQQINFAFSINRDWLRKRFQEFKMLTPSITFTSQLTVNLTEYNKVKSFIYQITHNETPESLQSFQTFLADFKVSNPKCPYLFHLEKFQAPLENLLLLLTIIPKPTQQLRITA